MHEGRGWPRPPPTPPPLCLASQGEIGRVLDLQAEDRSAGVRGLYVQPVSNIRAFLAFVW